jgi:uncharacterized protein
MPKIKFITPLGEIIAELNQDSSPRTIEALLEFLPMKYTVPLRLWGEEVYFYLPDSLKEKIEAENARLELKVWDVAYWPRDPAICLFFGKTPLSCGTNHPVAAEPVNVIGTIIQGREILPRLTIGDAILMVQV